MLDQYKELLPDKFEYSRYLFAEREKERERERERERRGRKRKYIFMQEKHLLFKISAGILIQGEMLMKFWVNVSI